MMKNQAWKLLVFALGYMPVYCMERTNSVSLKLDDGAVRTIPWHVAQKSNTIYTQEAWKNRLEVDFKKPIIVHNVTPEQLALFIMAAPKTEDNFDDFFKRLTQESQKNLISVAGETALNSPEITALLVQTYLPDDIARLIMMHVKDGLEHYVRCAMVAQNGSQR